MTHFTQKNLWLFLTFLIGFQAWGQTFESSNLPILIIDTKGLEIPNEPKIKADFMIISNSTGQRNTLKDLPSYAGKIGIEQRGSTSRTLFPKKPYGFELRDAATGEEGISESLLGIPKEEDWVLNATYNDKTLLREVLTYEMAHRMSPRFASRTRFCEVVLNGKYEGIYILMEKIKRDKNRVDIGSLKPEDQEGDALTGGYLLKIDKTEGTASRFWNSPFPSSQNATIRIPIQVEYPKLKDLTEKQFNYIKNYITSFEEALSADSYTDPSTGYQRYIDVDSWIDYLILTEVTRNVDAYRLSTFFYKDRDSKGGKLVMGPIWDYNLAYGNVDYCEGEKNTGWAFDFNRVCPEDYYQMPFWWERLLSDPAFANRAQTRYENLRKNTLNTASLHAYIDSTSSYLQEARIRNFTRWPVIGQKVWPNYYVGPSYESEVNYLKNWLKDRLLWMDQAFSTIGNPVTSLEPNDYSSALTVFPNPAPHRDLRVRFSLDRSAVVKVQLMDHWGRVLQENSPLTLSAGTHDLPFTVHTAQHPAQLLFIGLDLNGVKTPLTRLLLE
ncbi:CotH kinase family protein [Arundinibacter roseus]|uniref:Spore coat protein CotH n=1 Tax=Arundinibacter roseus TaxID=2070510 RepID=A0A4V2XAJ8_9BACT|nr:CotH kinase family protein [Arundinibacter roseus]TDB67865.1 spore coat protein CotH [Arundinibacter roseus]